jgi:hypothetical protein
MAKTPSASSDSGRDLVGWGVFASASGTLIQTRGCGVSMLTQIRSRSSPGCSATRDRYAITIQQTAVRVSLIAVAFADAYLLGSYRIAMAPEPNSRRLTSFKSRCLESPATTSARVPRPWDVRRTRTRRSTQLGQCEREFDASHEQSLPGLPLEPLNGVAEVAANEPAFQSTRSSVLDTTYFFAALIVRAKGSIHLGLAARSLYQRSLRVRLVHELLDAEAKPSDHREHPVNLHAPAVLRTLDRRDADADFAGGLVRGQTPGQTLLIERGEERSGVKATHRHGRKRSVLPLSFA